MRIAVLLCLCCFLYAESNITYVDLRTEKFVLGICPSVGGRIYKLIADNQNLSVWDETLLYHWNRPGHYGYHLYGGNEIWLSPQSQWKKAWPPNMSISTDTWEVTEQSPTSISLQSKPKKDDAWQAKRVIKIINQESFSNTITLTNISDNEQHAGIWFMNRCPRDVKIHFPNDIKAKDDLSKALIKDGKIGDQACKLINHGDYRPGKVSYLTEKNNCVVTRNGVRWHINTVYTPDGKPHADQADFEIARLIGLLEFEYHGPYCSVKSKESISATETWRVDILNEK